MHHRARRSTIVAATAAAAAIAVAAVAAPLASQGAGSSGAGSTGAAPGVAAPAYASPGVVLVEIVDGQSYGMAFSPQRVSARLGDTVRFVQRGRLPHNVVFRMLAPGSDSSLARPSRYLERPGETLDLVLDARFRPGKHVYVCTPHEVLGMAGVLTVLPSEP
jgi:plastocyanin